MYNMIFVMGYDLLNKELVERDVPCDIAFDICKYIYKKFLTSTELNLELLNVSEYDALKEYIESNKEDIKIYIEKCY